MAMSTMPRPQRIEEIMTRDPVQAKAFLTGLEAGYNLGAAQGKEQKDENK